MFGHVGDGGVYCWLTQVFFYLTFYIGHVFRPLLMFFTPYHEIKLKFEHSNSTWLIEIGCGKLWMVLRTFFQEWFLRVVRRPCVLRRMRWVNEDGINVCLFAINNYYHPYVTFYFYIINKYRTKNTTQFPYFFGDRGSRTGSSGLRRYVVITPLPFTAMGSRLRK